MESSLKEAISKFPNISDAFEVVKTVDFVIGGNKRYRVEVVKSQKYSNSYSIKLWTYLQSDSQNARALFEIATMPTTESNTPELALKRAARYVASGDIALTA